MIVTSDNTALMPISSDASTGIAVAIPAGTPPGTGATRLPKTRPISTNTATGAATAPIAPSGSRTKILISSHVSCQSPRMRGSLVSNRVAGELQEHILEARLNSAEVGHADAMERQAVD